MAIHYKRSQSMAEQLLEEIQEMGVRGMIIQADITSESSVIQMQRVVAEQMGDPDIIVNNAVIQYNDWTTVLKQDVADYEGQFRSCVLQNVLMAKAFVPAMIRKRWGRIIAINTEAAMQNLPTHSAYVSGKRGMDGVLRVLVLHFTSSATMKDTKYEFWTAHIYWSMLPLTLA